MWEAVAGAVVSGLLGGKSRKTPNYTPNPDWLKMQTGVMNAVRAGVEAGGYTWDDAMNTILKRSAVESAATPYKGANERVVSSLAPYGAIGAMGRGLSSINTARAQEESTALRNVDIAREQQKQTSYGQLLGLGAGIQDPNLPQQNVNMLNAQRPSTAQNIGAGLSTGLGTYINLNQAQQNTDFWNNFQKNQMGIGNTQWNSGQGNSLSGVDNWFLNRS
jgi:hypothetical protein